MNQWKRNCWTGNDTLNVTKNGRIVRMNFHNPKGHLYRAEYWGDYSLEFPKFGAWCKTLSGAKKELAEMSKT